MGEGGLVCWGPDKAPVDVSDEESTYCALR